MAPEDWQKIKLILEQALEKKPEDRQHFLTAACNGDAALRSEVESLLEVEGVDLEPLEFSAYKAYVGINGQPKPGDRIERYEIVRELAVGGMGSVYLARRIDGAFDQQVALKLIKAGMDSDSIVRRFFTERQILASLKHPNIAQLMDGGTTKQGHPFFVMEYVEGSTIKEFVETHALDLNERLDLFCRVCSAVSFAHQNLIIHRDLKPSNVLVTGEGNPKLLDFGIAKLLTSVNETENTATQSSAFTPDYASPEQVLGEKLTTASDIYSLGIILYELLTGNRPYKTDNRNFSKIIQAVCEIDPSAPSRTRTLTASDGQENGNPVDRPIPASKLKGDLDNIVLKALRKEPERRYASVEQFSDDIRKYLTGQPVTASADTFTYRASKFVRRHVIAVAASALLVLTLIGGFATTLYQARIAKTERAKAEARFNDVRRLANSFVFEINDEIEKSPIKARGLLVQRATEYLDSLNQESANDPSLQAELAAAYEKIGDVQSQLFMPNLGNAGASLESHQKALELRTRLFETDPKNIDRGLSLVTSYLKVGDIYSVTGDIGKAKEEYQKAVDLNQKLAGYDPAGDEVLQQLSRSYLRLGQSILRSGSLSECLQNYETAFEINRQLVIKEPGNVGRIRLQSIVFTYIAYVRILMGDAERGVVDMRNALAVDQYILESDRKDLKLRDNLASSYLWLGIALRDAGHFAESVPAFNEALKIQGQIYELDKQNFGKLNSVADCNAELALAYAKEGNYAAAIPLFQSSIEQYSAVSANDPNDLSSYHQVFLERRLLGDAQLESGHFIEALKNFQTALPVYTELVAKDRNNLEWKYGLAICYSRIAKIMHALKNETAEYDNLQRTIPIFETIQSVSPQNVNYSRELNDARARLSHLPAV